MESGGVAPDNRDFEGMSSPSLGKVMSLGCLRPVVSFMSLEQKLFATMIDGLSIAAFQLLCTSNAMTSVKGYQYVSAMGAYRRRENCSIGHFT